MSLFDYGGGISGTLGTQTGTNDPDESPSTGTSTGPEATDTQSQLDAADPNITFKSATKESELQKDLDMTAQTSQTQTTDSSTNDEPDPSLPAATTVDKFLEIVAKTWPSPEILSVNFDQKVGERIEKIKVKVKVTGDFLSDEWFWGDFLKYFKLKVYLVPYMTGDNSDIYNVGSSKGTIGTRTSNVQRSAIFSAAKSTNFIYAEQKWQA